MKNKNLIASFAAAAILMSVAVMPVSAANLGDKQFVSKKSSCSDYQKKEHRHNISMQLLSKITGKSVEELETQYPQKTAFQIAKSLGKLDELKKSYLDNAKSAIDGLVENKKISKEDGAAMYKDIEKRINAIDGVNIVVPGRPSFRPNLNSKSAA
jgi:hypothetical protein